MLRRKRLLTGFSILLMVFGLGCDFDPSEVDEGDLKRIPYSPERYRVNVPSSFPELEVPGDNPLTKAGVALGRKLFFDPILSRDSTQSCSSCHHPDKNFTDGLATSKGVDLINGRRSAMALIDIGFQTRGLFWDGRSQTLEGQALLPVEDPVEMHFTWPGVIERLKRHPEYPTDFRRAFGIDSRDSITKFLAAKAIAQFERTLISSGTTRYDQALTPGSGIFFSESELRGFEMYFDKSGGRLPDAECFHCHNAPLFSSLDYFNNGIQQVKNGNQFDDNGLGAITGNVAQNGMFKAPSLRNIAQSAPYMHDGRFKTLEEVIEHYNSGGHPADNKNPFIRKLGLTAQQKADLLAFLHTLTDTSFAQKPDYKSPF